MNITIKQAVLLHNIIRYPILIISYLLQVLALFIYWIGTIFINISRAWGMFIINHFKIK